MANPSFTGMKVEARSGANRPATVEFDAGDQDPVEIMEAFERLLKAWPESRVPLKLGRSGQDAVCGCGAEHGGWVCSHCTPTDAASQQRSDG